MNDVQNFRKPHLTKDQRLPRCYKEVEKVLEIVKKCEGNVKTVLYNRNLPRNIFKRVYALTFEVLKQSHVLNAIVKEIQLFEKEPSLRKELAGILIYEMIFGKGLLGNSKPIEVIKGYQIEIKEAYNYLSGNGTLSKIGPTKIPKYVRINTLSITMQEVLEDLEYLGVKQILFDEAISEKEFYVLVKNLEKDSFLIDFHFQDLLVFHGERNLTSWSLYQKGHVLIQDKSSYIPVHVLRPEPGANVIDACAAPGMKTLHLAAIMENKGVIYAFERNKSRCEVLGNMMHFSHSNICQTFCQDFNLVDPYDEKFSSVEYILLDPSCSGSGMVSRMDFATDTEESKNDVRIQKLAGFQIILLKHALLFPSVKRVVYSTCSTTETENEYVVHEVLNHFNQRFKLVHVLPGWPIRGSEKYEFGPLCVRAYPDKSLTNGFFVAMFERIEFSSQYDNDLSNKNSLTGKNKKHLVDTFHSNEMYKKKNKCPKRNKSNDHKKNFTSDGTECYEMSPNEMLNHDESSSEKLTLSSNNAHIKKRKTKQEEISNQSSILEQSEYIEKPFKKKHKNRKEQRNHEFGNTVIPDSIQFKQEDSVQMNNHFKNDVETIQNFNLTSEGDMCEDKERKTHKKNHKRKKSSDSNVHTSENISTLSFSHIEQLEKEYEESGDHNCKKKYKRKKKSTDLSEPVYNEDLSNITDVSEKNSATLGTDYETGIHKHKKQHKRK